MKLKTKELLINSKPLKKNLLAVFLMLSGILIIFMPLFLAIISFLISIFIFFPNRKKNFESLFI
jgi:hypothetical protein